MKVIQINGVRFRVYSPGWWASYVFAGTQYCIVANSLRELRSECHKVAEGRP